jgi:hypothetical protein
LLTTPHPTLLCASARAARGHAVNSVGLLGLRAPSVLWTYSAADFQGDFDRWARRHLYMGVYPMAPFPGNDHAIPPSTSSREVDYRRYSPLFAALKGKVWVLEAHAARAQAASSSPRHVRDGIHPKVNAFELRGGARLWPLIVEGHRSGVADEVVVDLKLPAPDASARGGCQQLEALFPGASGWGVLSNVRFAGGRATAQVSLPPNAGGCALLRCAPS